MVVFSDSHWRARSGEGVDRTPVAVAVGAAVGAYIEVVGRQLVKTSDIVDMVGERDDGSVVDIQRAGAEHDIPAAFGSIGAVLGPVDGGGIVGQGRGVDIARLDARRQQADLDVVHVYIVGTCGRSQKGYAACGAGVAVQRYLILVPRIGRSDVGGLDLLNQLEGADVVGVGHDANLNLAVGACRAGTQHLEVELQVGHRVGEGGQHCVAVVCRGGIEIEAVVVGRGRRVAVVGHVACRSVGICRRVVGTLRPAGIDGVSGACTLNILEAVDVRLGHGDGVGQTLGAEGEGVAPFAVVAAAAEGADIDIVGSVVRETAKAYAVGSN